MKTRADRILVLLTLASGCLAFAAAGETAPARVRELALFAGPQEGVELTGPFAFVPEGPKGETVLRVNGSFNARIDLKKLGVDPLEYDMAVLDVKSDPHAWLKMALENYPQAPDMSHWWCLDSSRGRFDWRPLWISLKEPEEIKPPKGKRGMAEVAPDMRGLRLEGHVSDLKRVAQDPGRTLWIRNLRLVKLAVELDWDQAQAPYTWGEGKDLVYAYPLTVANRLDRPVTAKLALLPFKVESARGELSAERVELQPGEKKIVEARVILPAAEAARKPPLYCELFEARAEAEGLADSAVTILRSSDPIHLGVTVPLPEEKLQYPLFGAWKDKDPSITGLTEKSVEALKKLADDAKPEDLDLLLTDPSGLQGGDSSKGTPANAALQRWESGLTGCAWLYEATGERAYLEKGTALLLRAAELAPALFKAWKDQPIRRISAGVFTQNTLGMGFRIAGTQRPPYLAENHGITQDFDLLARDMNPEARAKILRDFLLPVGVHVRNHYFGLGNQQCTVNYLAMYCGMVTRNWPLVSFTYSSEHGLLNHFQWGYDDDGLCTEGHYQTYTINPMLWQTELLLGRGFDHYDRRWHQIIHSQGAEAISKSYLYPKLVAWLDKARFGGKPFMADLAKTGDGYHLAAATLLRWQGLEVMMNWKTHVMRGNNDRCSLWIKGSPFAVGGVIYSHSSFGHSVIIVDEEAQHHGYAEPVSHDVEGPVQHVSVVDTKDYPGSTIHRTFALLDKHVLVLDRLSSETPRTVDWCLLGAGKELSLSMDARQGSFTTKPDNTTNQITYGAKVASHRYAASGETWTEGKGRMRMLGAPGTEVFVFDFGDAKKSEPYLMVRRKGVTKTDFAAFFSTETESIESAPVAKADGSPADAAGVKVTLKGGKSFHALVSYEPAGTEVVLGTLKTKARFATDFE
ncbi:MAG: hypothetical protein M5U26_08210 [Planctomycetota bacterium]|nr:hypothetical protein [Planctomycetota bacterium]